MGFDVVRIAEHIHGHLGWLAAAALTHPAILLRKTKRKAHLSVALSTGFATSQGVLGAWLYGPYRDQLKQRIFIDDVVVVSAQHVRRSLGARLALILWCGA